MVNPTLDAAIVAAGGIYKNWKSVSIERTAGAVFSYMTFTAAEPGPSTSPPSWSNLQLMPGTPVQGYLAGQLAITGFVMVRQAAYDANHHEVQIVVASKTQKGEHGTVASNTGQYLNANLQQIANAVMNPVGVTVVVDPVPNANKSFPRVSEHIGEGRIDFLRRLAMMRDLHMMDDENGILHFMRGSMNSHVADLAEGRNILKARMVLNAAYSASDYVTLLQQPGGSSTGVITPAQLAQVTGTAHNPDYTGDVPQVFKSVGQMPGDAVDAQLLAQNELALDAVQYVECIVTVPGWLAPNGTLWCARQNLGKRVVINSPMLIPENPFYLLLRSAKHMQDDQGGSVTDLTLCTARGLSDHNYVGSSIPQ